MIITENVTAEFAATPGEKYVFSASGDFGGGTISLQWCDGTEWVTFLECNLGADGDRVVTAPARLLRFLVEGSSSPNLSANVLPLSEMPGARAASAARIVEVADEPGRLALAPSQVNAGDIVFEAGVKQVTRVIPRADSSGDLASCAFVVGTAQGNVGFWFSVDGTGADPGSGGINVEVSISTGDSAGTIAAAIAHAAVASNMGNNYWESVLAEGSQVLFTDSRSGEREAFNDATDFEIEPLTEGKSSGGRYLVVDVNKLEGEDGWFSLAGPSAASDEQAGLVELATVSETQAGLDSTRAVTPAGAASAFQTKILCAVLAADQVVTNSATLVTALSLYLPVGTYFFEEESCTYASSLTAAGCQTSLSFIGGSVTSKVQIHRGPAAANNPVNQPLAFFVAGPLPYTFVSATFSTMDRIFGTIVVSSPTTVVLQVAQATAKAGENATMKAGSYMRAMKIA